MAELPLQRPPAIPIRRRTLIAAALSLPASAVFAQSAWPQRPVKFLVPAPPAGPSDLFARLLAAHCSTAFSTPFVVENRPGAAGGVATQALVRSPADGYTFLIGSNSTFVLTPMLQKNPGYDPVRDFAPVGIFTSYPALLLARPDAPFKDLPSLVAYARANPGKLNFASFGVGSLGHMANEYLCHQTGIKVTHVNYPGTAAVVQALLKGEADYATDSYGNTRSLVDTGKLLPLAVTSTRRDSRLPQTPTLAAAGISPIDVRIWLGFIAPAGTPPEIVAKLNAAIVEFAELPDTRQRLENLASDLDTESPAAMGQRLANERRFWAGVVRDAKVVVE